MKSGAIMRTVISNVLTITYPTPEVEKWCKDNLVLSNPEYAKKERMGFWLGNTPKQLHLYERRGDALILPFGCYESIFPLISKTLEYAAFSRLTERFYASPIPMYDYQTIAVENMIGAVYGILRAPAGSGKTQMGLELIRQIGTKALWITHTKDLLKQSKDRASLYFDSKLLGVISEGKVEIGRWITFATVQTLSRLDLTQYKDEWDVVVVDECHRVAGTPTAVTQFSHVLNSLAARHKYGLSATVHRADGMIKATYALLGPVKYTVPDEAVKERVMQVGIKVCGTELPESYLYCESDGMINHQKLVSYIVGDWDRNVQIVNDIRRNATHSCLILSDRIEHLEILKDMLDALLQPYAALITGKMTTKKGKAEREAAIEDMRSGKKRFLFATYSLAKEGLDIPILDRLFLVTPQKDYAVITQSIGRIARRVKEKDEPIVYDYVDGNIQYLYNCFKKRKTIYRKNNCYEAENYE